MKRLRFTSIQAQNSESVVAAIISYLGERLGLDAHFVDDVSWQERESLLDQGSIDVGWICGLPYVWKKDGLEEEIESRVGQSVGGGVGTSSVQTPGSTGRASGIELLAAPVMRGRWYRGAAVYFSDVMVHRGSQFRSYRSQLRVLTALGPSPAPPWVVRSDLPASLRGALRRELLAMHQDARGRKILLGGQTASFIAVTDRDYDPIREMYRHANGVRLAPGHASRATPRGEKLPHPAAPVR